MDSATIFVTYNPRNDFEQTLSVRLPGCLSRNCRQKWHLSALKDTSRKCSLKAIL